MKDRIDIKKSHEGRLTAKAEEAGNGSSLQYAKHVLAHNSLLKNYGHCC